MHKSVIVDSSGIVSLALPVDANNTKALKISKAIFHSKKNLLIPSDVFSETLNVLGKKTERAGTFLIGQQMLVDKRFMIHEVTTSIRLHALQKFQKQPSSVSFTDCLVMAFADAFYTKEIFGFGEAFLRNGYIRVGIDKK